MALHSHPSHLLVILGKVNISWQQFLLGGTVWFLTIYVWYASMCVDTHAHVTHAETRGIEYQVSLLSST